MQLDRLVHFHKTVGDKTRIRIISLLKYGPLHGQALADKLGLTPPTISYHITKLKEIGIIYQRRDKNTIYFYLHENKLKLMAEAILQLGNEIENKMIISTEEKDHVIKNFFTDDGSLKDMPTKRKNKMIVLEHLIKGLKIGRIYNEKDINEYISQFHEDYATIRRELIMCHFMHRQHEKYELNPKEMWLI